MNTDTFIKQIKVKHIIGDLPPNINGIQMDSKKVEPGNVFACLVGHVTDGHKFAQEAVKRGAVMVIAEKEINIDSSKSCLIIVKNASKVMARLANLYFDYPYSEITTLGVTGTNGKTTVSHMIHQLLLLKDHKSAVAGTLGFYLNETMSPTENTTSDIASNLKMTRKAVEENCHAMIYEASSQGLVNGRMSGIDIDVAIFTNLDQDHLDYHQTMEQYGQAKGLLFSQLGQDLKRNKFAILNADDPWSARYSQMTPFEVISYGFHNGADFRAGSITYSKEKTTFTLYSPEGAYYVESNFIGKFNVYNILSAVAALYAIGSELDSTIDKLQFLSPVKGRMEKLGVTSGPDIYVDYAHTPDGIKKVIESVLPFKKGRLIVLIAAGANRDVTKRPLMAEKASLADYVIITTNNPGNEPAESILADLEEGMLHDQYVTIGDREKAIRYTINISEPDDIIILTDKGHQTTQLIGHKRLPFSDKEIVLDQINQTFASEHLLNR